MTPIPLGTNQRGQHRSLQQPSMRLYLSAPPRTMVQPTTSHPLLPLKTESQRPRRQRLITTFFSPNIKTQLSLYTPPAPLCNKLPKQISPTTLTSCVFNLSSSLLVASPLSNFTTTLPPLPQKRQMRITQFLLHPPPVAPMPQQNPPHQQPSRQKSHKHTLHSRLLSYGG